MYRTALRKLPKPEFKQVAQEGLKRASHPKRVSVDYGKLAVYMVNEFNARYHKEYVEYFTKMGFSRETILDSSILFRFMSIISYDMRPLSYRQVWGPPHHPEFDNNSVKQALEQLGLDLTSVREMEEETLRKKLHSRVLKLRNDIFRMDVHDWKERGYIDHATGLKDLANNIDTIARLFKDLAASRDIKQLYDTIDSIRGFGPALTSKTILFIVRCFGVGFREVDPKDLRPIADGLLKEYVVESRAKRLRGNGVDIQVLLGKLIELGDPLVLEYLYLLDDEKSFRDLLTHIN